MTRRLRIAPHAQVQIEAAADWWFEHRPDARTLFHEELERAFEMIRGVPGVGQTVSYAHRPGVRRVYLGRTRYHLYYRDADQVIEVLALWHASRGARPQV